MDGQTGAQHVENKYNNGPIKGEVCPLRGYKSLEGE